MKSPQLKIIVLAAHILVADSANILWQQLAHVLLVGLNLEVTVKNSSAGRISVDKQRILVIRLHALQVHVRVMLRILVLDGHAIRLMEGLEGIGGG